MMAKNDNAHAIRMIDSLRQTVGEDAAYAFGEAYSLSKIRKK